MSEETNYPSTNNNDNNNSNKKPNNHKKPIDNKKFADESYDDDMIEQNFDENIEYEIEKMHILLEKLRQTKRDLENDNENLDCKIDNLKKIIKRIQDENEGI